MFKNSIWKLHTLKLYEYAWKLECELLIFHCNFDFQLDAHKQKNQFASFCNIDIIAMSKIWFLQLKIKNSSSSNWHFRLNYFNVMQQWGKERRENFVFSLQCLLNVKCKFPLNDGKTFSDCFKMFIWHAFYDKVREG